MSTQPLKEFVDHMIESATERFGYRPYLTWMQRWRDGVDVSSTTADLMAERLRRLAQLCPNKRKAQYIRAAAFAAGMAAEYARFQEDPPIDVAPNLCCPGCGSHKHLGRIEDLLGLALIDVKSRSGKTYSFVGETKVEWDTQSRERCGSLPEFHCLRCHHEFNVPGAKCAEEGT
jgi:hypothetical protein